MNNKSILKLVGSFRKQYKKKADTFQKKHYRKEEFYWELNGYKMAKSISITVPQIIKIDEDNLSIYFKNTKASRLDQVILKRPSKIFEATKNAARLIANFHEKTKQNKIPSFQLAKVRMIKMQNELAEFGDIPAYLSKNIQKIIKNELKKIRKTTSTSFIHGDFALQNMFFSGNKISIFDWENSCFSDPLYDIGIYLSFLGVIAIKFGKLSPKDMEKIETILLNNYSKANPGQILDINKIHFYQIFSCHTTYWFYLYLFDQLNQKYKIPLLTDYLFGKKCSLIKLYKELAQFFDIGPKYSSFVKVYHFLSKNFWSVKPFYSRPLELNFDQSESSKVLMKKGKEA